MFRHQRREQHDLQAHKRGDLGFLGKHELSGPALDRVLQIFELEKAVYELRYELNNRPDWVRIPIRGVLELMT